VVGANGAGKTTLLYLLGGVITATTGDVEVFGMHRWRQNFEIRKRSAVLPAWVSFGTCVSAYDYLRLVAGVYGVTEEAFHAKLALLAEEMDMLPHLGVAISGLSMGMAMKTALIGAFLPELPLRILDEPFANGVDPLGTEALYGWISAASQRGETTVFSTQALEQADTAAGRIIMLRCGEMVADGTPDAVIRSAGCQPDEQRALSNAFVKLAREPR
jgi:ABC-2 type transport system ATP-binding protein